MRVLRLEYQNEGVFAGSVVTRSIDKVIADRGGDYPELHGFKSPLSPFRHPDPGQDVPAWAALDYDTTPARRDFYCGFKDEKQLLRWFDVKEVRDVMTAFGVQMLEFDVDPKNVLIGTAQIMFWKSKATFVSKVPLPIFAA